MKGLSEFLDATMSTGTLGVPFIAYGFIGLVVGAIVYATAADTVSSIGETVKDSLSFLGSKEESLDDEKEQEVEEQEEQKQEEQQQNEPGQQYKMQGGMRSKKRSKKTRKSKSNKTRKTAKK